MIADAIAWGSVWLVVAMIIALVAANDGEQDYRRFALALAAALLWPAGAIVVVVVVSLALIGFAFYGFYLWGKLACLELRRLVTKHEISAATTELSDD